VAQIADGPELAPTALTRPRVPAQTRPHSTGAEVCSNEDHQRPIRVLAFSTDGMRLLTAGDDKQVKLWDTATWACTKTL
jgi:WD40 repeat protein